VRACRLGNAAVVFAFGTVVRACAFALGIGSGGVWVFPPQGEALGIGKARVDTLPPGTKV
jgi:hypothetical protein